jgi:hypothetical protein
MLVALRREYAQLITSGAQAGLLVFALQDPARGVLDAVLGVIAAISVFAWVSTTRRARAIGDTPTSRIASAAQGYVELKGRGRQLDGLPLLSPLTGLACLWFRYRIERHDGERWVDDGGDESTESFALDDGTGRCLVDPEGAEMLVSRKETWSQGERRYTQWLLTENDPVYVLGEYSTRGAVDLHLDPAADTRSVLAEWKKDREQLLKRFDLNGDGQIDLDEWELARRQARREVEREHREARSQSDVSVMQRPADGRLYLISNLDPDRLANRYRWWSAFHIGFFFVGVGWLAYLWR